MKMFVDPDLCISCGLCINTCPEVFDWDDENKAKAIVDTVPGDAESTAKEAMDGCPTEAIKEA